MSMSKTSTATGFRSTGYRRSGSMRPADTGAADALGGDMGLLARFVAINLLFTSSPLYDPLVTAPAPRGSKVAHISMFEDDPDEQWCGLCRSEVHTCEISEACSRTIGGRWASERLRSHRCRVQADPWISSRATPRVRAAGFHSAAHLRSCSATTIANLAKYVPAYGDRDYVGETLCLQHHRCRTRPIRLGLFGYRRRQLDGRHTDLRVCLRGAISYREAGFGFTSTIVHEFGHHVGLSHPHDGYDSEFGFRLRDRRMTSISRGSETRAIPSCSTSRSATDSVTHNTDNMRRWEVAGYLEPGECPGRRHIAQRARGEGHRRSATRRSCCQRRVGRF